MKTPGFLTFSFKKKAPKLFPPDVTGERWSEDEQSFLTFHMILQVYYVHVMINIIHNNTYINYIIIIHISILYPLKKPPTRLLKHMWNSTPWIFLHMKPVVLLLCVRR